MNKILQSSTGSGLSATFGGAFVFFALYLNSHFGFSIDEQGVVGIIDIVVQIGSGLIMICGLLRKLKISIEKMFGLNN